MSDTDVIWLVILVVAIWLCFLPGLIARRRRHRNAMAITALDILLFLLFLGICADWLFGSQRGPWSSPMTRSLLASASSLGWIGGLVWSLTADVLPRTEPKPRWQDTNRAFEDRIGRAVLWVIGAFVLLIVAGLILN
ncbi:MAG: hypothetical protein ACRCVA_17725 [Phreatobacter sp.]